MTEDVRENPCPLDLRAWAADDLRAPGGRAINCRKEVGMRVAIQSEIAPRRL